MHTAADVATDPRFMLAVIAFAALLLTCLGVIFWVRKWRKSLRASESNSEDELSQFRQLYQEGELDDEEFERICRMLDKNDVREADQEKGSR